MNDLLFEILRAFLIFGTFYLAGLGFINSDDGEEM